METSGTGAGTAVLWGTQAPICHPSSQTKPVIGRFCPHIFLKLSESIRLCLLTPRMGVSNFSCNILGTWDCFPLIKPQNLSPPQARKRRHTCADANQLIGSSYFKLSLRSEMLSFISLTQSTYITVLLEKFSLWDRKVLGTLCSFETQNYTNGSLQGHFVLCFAQFDNQLYCYWYSVSNLRPASQIPVMGPLRWLFQIGQNFLVQVLSWNFVLLEPF